MEMNKETLCLLMIALFLFLSFFPFLAIKFEQYVNDKFMLYIIMLIFNHFSHEHDKSDIGPTLINCT